MTVQQAQLAEPAADSRTILVVDDEGRLRENLVTLLSSTPYRVWTAGDGLEAIGLLERERVDLVITDIMMERADGFAILDWVHKNAPRTLVTVLTGYASMESTIRAMRMGAFDYLVKPFDFELLTISIDRAMTRIEAEREVERANSELARWSEQLAVINELGRKAAETLSERHLLESVARTLHERFGYHHVYFSMVESQGRMVIPVRVGAHEAAMPEGFSYDVGTGITGKVVATSQPVLVNDVREDHDYFPLLDETRAQLALPIVVKGTTIGALSVESEQVGAFDRRDVSLLQTLADMVASSIQSVRLFRQVKETKDYLEVLIGSSADAIVTTDTRGVVTFFSPGAESVYGYPRTSVEGKPMARFYHNGAREAARVMSLLRKYERLKNYETVLLGRDARRIHASISASLLRDRHGCIIGTLGVSKDITHRVELEQKLKELTITDGLTGLFNQRHFHRQLEVEMERARRQRRDLALMLFDLDRFKEYNDTRGHLEGDRLLRSVGQRLLESIRNMVDSGFRYGGDEFIVLLPELGGEQALSVCRRIKQSVEGGLDGVTLSTGLVGFRPGYSAEEFVRLADEAMYESKKERAGRIVTR